MYHICVSYHLCLSASLLDLILFQLVAFQTLKASLPQQPLADPLIHKLTNSHPSPVLTDDVCPLALKISIELRF